MQINITTDAGIEKIILFYSSHYKKITVSFIDFRDLTKGVNLLCMHEDVYTTLWIRSFPVYSSH